MRVGIARSRRTAIARSTAAAAALALTLAACGGSANTESAASGEEAETTSDDGSSEGASYLVPEKEGPYVVGLANSFVGNSWRTQMVAELEYAAEQRPDVIEKVLVTNANNDVAAQNSQISDLVAQGVDILLVNATSETAVNAELERAHDKGVVIVSFDNTVSTPVALRVNPDQGDFGRAGAEWLVEAMGGSGSVFALNGAAGAPVSEARWAAAKEVLEEAGIEIVAEANADWDLAQGRAAAADLLAAHPDVTGVYSQGGAMSLGVLQALEAAGRDPLPVPGEGNNEFLKAWKQLNDDSGWTSIAPSQSPALVVAALDVALAVLAGEDPGAEPSIELPVITQDDLDEYVRPDLPDSLWLPTDLPEDEIQTLFS
jgi:ribose transport system substrate-binding protein